MPYATKHNGFLFPACHISDVTALFCRTGRIQSVRCVPDVISLNAFKGYNVKEAWGQAFSHWMPLCEELWPYVYVYVTACASNQPINDHMLLIGWLALHAP